MRVRGLLIAVAALALVPAADAATVVVVNGRGFGHGIGMSQYGARGMAVRGHGYAQILAHYYPGTRLGPAPMSHVRVLLDAARKKVVVGSRSTFRLVDGRGRRYRVRGRELRLGPKLLVRLNGKRVRLASPVRVAPGGRPLRFDGKPFRGELVLRSRGGRMSVVNEVGLERYLRGVVPYEMPDDWPRQALRAQAVVARSYALATLKPGKIYDLHDDVRSQVYGGIDAETPQTSFAVGATAGRVLLWRGEVATTFYHSTSGGRTVPAWTVWTDASRLPYLRGVRDPFDGGPHHAWGPVVVPAAKVAKRLGVRGLRDVAVAKRTGGRVTAVTVVGRGGPRTVDGIAFRRALDLRSTWIRVGVLRLDRPAARGPLVLSGLARGVRTPFVEHLSSGRWRTVARVRPRADGAFRIVLRQRVPGRYRLAAAGASGPAVRVRVAAN